MAWVNMKKPKKIAPAALPLEPIPLPSPEYLTNWAATLAASKPKKSPARSIARDALELWNECALLLSQHRLIRRNQQRDQAREEEKEKQELEKPMSFDSFLILLLGKKMRRGVRHKRFFDIMRIEQRQLAEANDVPIANESVMHEYVQRAKKRTFKKADLPYYEGLLAETIGKKA